MVGCRGIKSDKSDKTDCGNHPMKNGYCYAHRKQAPQADTTEDAHEDHDDDDTNMEPSTSAALANPHLTNENEVYEHDPAPKRRSRAAMAAPPSAPGPSASASEDQESELVQLRARVDNDVRRSRIIDEHRNNQANDRAKDMDHISDKLAYEVLLRSMNKLAMLQVGQPIQRPTPKSEEEVQDIYRREFGIGTRRI